MKKKTIKCLDMDLCEYSLKGKFLKEFMLNENEVGLFLLQYTKINSTYIITLHVKPNTVKLLDEVVSYAFCGSETLNPILSPLSSKQSPCWDAAQATGRWMWWASQWAWRSYPSKGRGSTASGGLLVPGCDASAAHPLLIAFWWEWGSDSHHLIHYTWGVSSSPVGPLAACRGKQSTDLTSLVAVQWEKCSLEVCAAALGKEGGCEVPAIPTRRPAFQFTDAGPCRPCWEWRAKWSTCCLSHTAWKPSSFCVWRWRRSSPLDHRQCSAAKWGPVRGHLPLNPWAQEWCFLHFWME